ncbi:MAG: methylenetetrahydrofolate reductase [Propionibacteriaceae bacterium]|nr:methylenetetrahydrofolate reductase [Propionibacteriaceae bacterium]
MPAGIVERLTRADGPTFSVEFFPPSDDAGVQQLIGTVDALGGLRPDWLSVTYGATGASRYKTFSAVGAIRGTADTPLIGHLTVAGQSLGEIRRALDAYARLGVTNILALRGDPPGGGVFEAHPDGFINATELVRFIKGYGDFTVGVAAFANPHPEGSSELDAQILLEKQAAGAEFAVSQMFFDPQVYVSMVGRFRALGGTMPVVAGIMPITVPSQIERFGALSGAALPAAFVEPLLAVSEDRAGFREVGVDLVTQLCRDVLDAGAPGLQFFTLNRSTATAEILGRLRAEGLAEAS